MLWRRARLTGGLAALAGTALVMALVLVMNAPAPPPTGDDALSGSRIEVVKKSKPPQPEQRRPEPAKRKPQKAPTAPLPGLASGLSGLDFGLPQFDDGGLDLGAGLLGDARDVVMTDDTVDQAPRPLMQTPMQYPPRARAQGVTGYVVLSLLISPTGQVEQVKVLEASPSGVFDEAAVAGVRGWTFEPAQYKGESVRVWARQKIRFDLS